VNKQRESDHQVEIELLAEKRNRYFYWLIQSPVIAVLIIDAIYVFQGIFKTGLYLRHRAFFDWMSHDHRMGFVALSFVLAWTIWLFIASRLADRKFPETKNLGGYYC